MVIFFLFFFLLWFIFFRLKRKHTLPAGGKFLYFGRFFLFTTLTSKQNGCVIEISDDEANKQVGSFSLSTWFISEHN